MRQAINCPDVVPELIADSLRLRELCEEDIPSWFERATDVESAWLAGDPIPESIAKGAQWLERHRERFRQQTAIRWAIVIDSAPQSVGTIGLAIISNEERVAELGIVIARAHWSKGIGSSAARRVARFAFETLDLIEIRAELLASNLASRRLLENVGFRLHSMITDFEQTEAGSIEGCLYVLQPR